MVKSVQSSTNVTVNSILALAVDPSAVAVNTMVFIVPPSSRLVVLIDNAPVYELKVKI